MSHHDITPRERCVVDHRMESAVDYLVKATPTGGLLELPAEERDDLMAREREVATALVGSGVITWLWRLPDSGTSLGIRNAESAEALEAQLRTLPIFPYNVVEVTALAPHPAFPAPLRASAEPERHALGRGAGRCPGLHRDTSWIRPSAPRTAATPSAGRGSAR